LVHTLDLWLALDQERFMAVLALDSGVETLAKAL
jgi:hypothetical protein